MGYGAVLVAVLVLAIGIRLSFGPIDLGFARSLVAQEFDTPDGKMTLAADRIYAEWGGTELPIKLVFNGLRLINGSKVLVATAPSVALSFQPASVLKARFLPTAIVVEQPTLNAEITREGGMLQRIFTKADTSSQGEVVGLLVEQLMAEPNFTTLLGQLDTVRVERARFTLRDVPSGVVWAAPDVKAELKRDASGVIITASGHFNNGGGPVGVALSGVYARDRSRISVEARIDGLKPPMFAALSPDAELLRGVDVALAGRMRLEASGAGDIRTAAVEVTAGPGTLKLPGILPATHKIRSLNAVAQVDAATHTANIDHITLDLDGVTATVTGTGTRMADGQHFTGRAELRKVPVDRLGEYWPIDFAPGGRAWALENVSHGTLDVIAELGLSTPGDDLSQLKVDRSIAFLDYRGMSVRYMQQMPELADIAGTARYEGNMLHFDIARGAGAGLDIANATVDLLNLDQPSPQQLAKLHVPITGPASAAISLLARPKLGLSRDMLYDPKKVGGTVAVDLSLSFPLLNSITVADLALSADAILSHVSIKDVLGSVDLSDANGRMSYGDQKFGVTGTGKLDGAPVEIAWHEQYGPRVPWRRRYELKGTVPAASIGKAGFPSPEPFLTGPIEVKSLTYQVAPNGTGEVQGRFDLKGAKASAPPVGWEKASGTEGTLSLGMKLAAGGRVSSIEFDGRGAGLTAKGGVRFGEDSTVQQVTVSQITLGRSDAGFEWRRRPGGVDVEVSGRSLELSRIREALKSRDESAKATPGGAAEKSRESTRVSVSLNQLLVKRGSLGALTGKLEIAGERLVSADMGIAAGKTGTFRVQPAAGGRNVIFYVADFGLLLRETGWLDGLNGGYLSFQGHFDDSVAQSPLSGTLKLGPYRLEKVTPRPDVDTLNSAIDGLNRAGNALQQFDGLEADIVKTGERVDVRHGRTSGRSIGLTTQGYLDLATDTARLRGVVVPGFALNNLLSNVPLLGPLITGGKDAGIFAISYRLEGPFDNLKSDINMMSVATPGALRDLFNSGSGGSFPDGNVGVPTPQDHN